MTKKEAAAHLQGMAIGSGVGFAVAMAIGKMGGVILLFVALLVIYGAYRLERPIEQ